MSRKRRADPSADKSQQRQQGRRDARPVRLLADDGDYRVGDVLTLERTPAGDHLVEHAAEGPDVRALSTGLPLACSGAM